MQLGDARSGKLAANMAAFGRVLRRAGVPVDTSRIALAQQALMAVPLASKTDVCAALEATLIGREQDRAVFAEAFEVFFKNPDMAQKLLAQMLPSAQGKLEPARRPRLAEALNPKKAVGALNQKPKPEQKLDFDMAMTASDAQRLKNADFNALGLVEYQLVMRLAQTVPMPLPEAKSRRAHAGTRGAAINMAATLKRAAPHMGEPLALLRRQRQTQPLPLVVLVDVSGSMERYTRLLLSFLHAATAAHKSRRVFSFGQELTDLSPAFKLRDVDAMLARTNTLVQDFAGGTHLGASLAQLRALHKARQLRLVGRRTVVLLVSDGLDTGESAALQEELQWLKRHTGRLLWLNPLMRYEHYQPSAQAAQVLHRQADGMLAVHNLASLEQLAQSLAQLLK